MASPGCRRTSPPSTWSRPAGRTGFLLRQQLDDALAKTHGGKPVYRMNLAIGEARYPRGVRIDAVATRYEYVLTASYVLTTVATARKPSAAASGSS
jgi:hypothetical protein